MRDVDPAAQMLQGQSAPSGAQTYFFYTCLPEIIAHVLNRIHAGFCLPQSYVSPFSALIAWKLIQNSEN